MFQHGMAYPSIRLTCAGDFIDHISVREIAIKSNHLHNCAHWRGAQWKRVRPPGQIHDLQFTLLCAGEKYWDTIPLASHCKLQNVWKPTAISPEATVKAWMVVQYFVGTETKLTGRTASNGIHRGTLLPVLGGLWCEQMISVEWNPNTLMCRQRAAKLTCKYLHTHFKDMDLPVGDFNFPFTSKAIWTFLLTT